MRQCCKFIWLFIKLGQYYLLDESQVSITFLKDLLSGKKKVIIVDKSIAYKIKDITSIVVPQFEELSSKAIYIKFKGYYHEIIEYFQSIKKILNIFLQKGLCGINLAQGTLLWLINLCRFR